MHPTKYTKDIFTIDPLKRPKPCPLTRWKPKCQVIDEIPYQVQKGKLIEKIAEIISSKKLLNVQNVRDESAEEIRIVIEPRSRNVERENLLSALYHYTDLETKISVNLNVLIDGISPKVSNLSELLKTFLYHRREILIRKYL